MCLKLENMTKDFPSAQINLINLYSAQTKTLCIQISFSYIRCNFLGSHFNKLTFSQDPQHNALIRAILRTRIQYFREQKPPLLRNSKSQSLLAILFLPNLPSSLPSGSSSSRAQLPFGPSIDTLLHCFHVPPRLKPRATTNRRGLSLFSGLQQRRQIRDCRP